MKRRIIASAVLLAIVITVCTVGQLTVDGCGKDISKLLDSAKTSIKKEDYKAAAHYSQKAEDKYVDCERKLSFFINHDLIEDLGVEVAKLNALAGEETADEFLSEISCAEVMLTHLMNDYKPSLYTVF